MLVVDIARKYIGSPYLFGADGNNPGEKWTVQSLFKM